MKHFNSLPSLQKAEPGFTLIELLVVIAIIGILSATAIPQYAAYKKRAFDARAKTDLANVAIAEEAYFTDAEKYLSCSNNSCANIPGVSRLSKGVALLRPLQIISWAPPLTEVALVKFLHGTVMEVG